MGQCNLEFSSLQPMQSSQITERSSSNPSIEMKPKGFITQEDIDAYRRAFDEIDTDHAQVVSTIKIQQVMKKLDVDINIHSLRQMISLVNDDSHDQLNFNQFVRFFQVCKYSSSKNNIRKMLFVAADNDFNNSIDVDELIQLFKRMDCGTESQKIELLFKQYSKDGEQLVLEEFNSLMDEVLRQK